jgi:hypothetical protein
MSDEEQVEQVVRNADELAQQMLALAVDNDMTALTALACSVYQEDPFLLPAAMARWHDWCQADAGQEAVSQMAEKVTLCIADAPVEESLTRMAFCDLLYAMEDRNGERAFGVWQELMDRGGWDVAVEVMSLMLGFAAYFMGWIHEV